MVDLCFVRLAGDPAAPELLVVGASLGTSVEPLWSRCVALLGDRFQVVGWDLPGHGASPPATGPFQVVDLADAVRSRAASLSGGRPAWYAGVSIGGVVGLQLGLDPGPFLAVAALASAPRIGDKQHWHERADLVRRAGTPAVVSGSSERWFAPGFAGRDPRTAQDLLTGLAGADRLSYAYACEALADLDLRDALTDLVVPVLVAPGEQDVVIAPDEVRALAALAPDLTVEPLAGCGHLPPAENPHLVADVLRTFLRVGGEG